MEFYVQSSLTFVNGLGQMALIAVLYGMVIRADPAPTLRAIMLGALFGLGAVISMAAPTTIAEGVVVDARAIIIGLSGAFGGIPAAILATTIACADTIAIGGDGVPYSLAGIMIAASAGMIWRHHWPIGRPVGIRGLSVLGLAIAAHAVIAPFMTDDARSASFYAYLAVITSGCLVATVTLGKMMQRELAQIMRERSLKDFAFSDPLTGLANRRSFERRLASAEFADGGKPFSLMILDVDRFKAVNDGYGHGAGDVVLRRIANTVRSQIRERDLSARFGGEEFVVLMPETGLEEAHALAERIRTSIAADRITLLGEVVDVTVSIGVACASEPNGRRDIVEIADEALYRAKDSGRNRTVTGDRGSNVVPLNALARRANRDGSYRLPTPLV